MRAALLDCFRGDYATREEPVSQSNGSKLRAVGRSDLAALPHQELGAAATDVNNEDLLVEHGQSLKNAEVDEPRLFNARDHIDVHAGLITCSFDKRLTVVRFPKGARSDGGDVGPETVGDLTESPQRGDSTFDGFGSQVGHVARPRTQPHHLLLFRDNVETPVGVNAGYEQVE